MAMYSIKQQRGGASRRKKRGGEIEFSAHCHRKVSQGSWKKLFPNQPAEPTHHISKYLHNFILCIERRFDAKISFVSCAGIDGCAATISQDQS
jgi:hypothetical protein